MSRGSSTAPDDGGRRGPKAWWDGQTTRRQMTILLVMAIVFVLAAGVAYLQPNQLAFSGDRTLGEVIESDEGPPASMTVRFTTDDGETVEATTSKIFALPPVGAALPIRYDPDDPSVVSDDLHREPSTLSTVFVAAFAVSIGAAFIAWRRGREQRRAAKRRKR